MTIRSWLLGLSFLGGILNCGQGMANTICVFDPVGANGDVFTTAEDLSLDFLPLGVRFELKLYLKESEARADFRRRKCDGVILTGLTAQEFNTFSAAIEAPGAVTSTEMLQEVLNVVASEQAAQYMVSNGVEVAGVYPAGAVYALFSDRRFASPKAMAGARMLILDDSDLIKEFARMVGAKQVPGSIDDFANKFKAGEADIIYAPMAIYEAMELDKPIRERGGVLDQPITYLTLQLLIHRDRFPADFGQEARRISLNHFEKIISISEKAEHKVPADIWINAQADRRQWEYLGMQLRRTMTEKGYYHPKMMKLLKHYRCKGNELIMGCE